MQNTIGFKINQNKGLIVKVTATVHNGRVRITPFRRAPNGGLRRAGGKWCDSVQFYKGVRVVLNYNAGVGNEQTTSGTWSSQSNQHEAIELVQQGFNMFVFTPPSPPSPPSPSSPPSPPSPPTSQPTDEQLLDAEHSSWYDNIVPYMSRRQPAYFHVMNEGREKWIRRGRKLDQLPFWRLQRVVMKAKALMHRR